MKVTQEKVIARMIKSGNNPVEAELKVKHNWEHIVRCYSDSKCKEVADVVATLGMGN